MKAILTFHSIDNSGSVLSFRPDLFAHLLAALNRADIPIVDLGTLLEPDTDRGVSLTFDDGMYSVFGHALPILRDHGAPAHIFITTGAVDSENQWPKQTSGAPSFEMLDWSQIEELHGSGVRIDAHTRSHPDLRKLSSAEIIDECEHANDKIERQVGRRPKFFAYPFGYHNRNARDVCRTIYDASVTTELRQLSKQEDLGALPRLDSYYLGSRWLIDRIDRPQTSIYLRTRWLLRTIRGTHCTASYDG